MDYGFKRAGILLLVLFFFLPFSNVFSQTCNGDPNSMVLDDDGDGYSNGDETQNLTDKCSAASVPFDFDHDYSSDLLDADDDNDGISDIADKFPQDANNGTSTMIPVQYSYAGADNGGIRGWGFTGLMSNGVDNYMNMFNVSDLTVGGAAKKFKVSNIPANDALNTTNNQKNGFQFGVNAGAFPFSFVVNGRVMAPFSALTPLDYRSMGIFMGTGDQDSYLKMVCAANAGAGGIEIVKEVAGVASSTMYAVSILGSTHVNLYLTVDPVTKLVQPSYSISGGLKTNLGPAISVPASWISNVMAVGIISTSRGATSFPATWDYIAVQPVQSAGDWVNVNTSNTCNARYESAFVQAGTKFYLLGGRGTKPVDIYNYGTKTWSTGATPPLQLHHFQAVELNGLIYAVCAFTGNLPTETPVANVYIYDPVANVWHVGMEIPEARRRGSAGAVAYNGKIYIVGGLTNGHISGWVSYVDEFDPETNTWKVLADAPRSRDHFQLALHDDKIYCIGGRNSGFGGSTYAHTIAETDIYDITDQSWNTLASPEGDIPTQRAGCSAATMGDEILVIGGESMEQTGSHNQTEALDINTNTWRTLDILNTGRHSTQALVSNFGVYTAVGCGSRGTTPELNSLEAFYLYGTSNPTGTSITKGALTVSASNMNFGNANLGVTNTQTLTLTNPSGNQALLIKVFQLSGGGNFSFDFPSNLPVALNPGESLSVSIKFTPASLGNKNGTFSITHNGTNGANTIINLSGNGTSPQNSPQGYLTAVPSTIVFPQTDVNVISAPITVSLTNTGGASLTINSASITGANASNFLQNFTGPVTVSAGSTYTFNITFTPSASGARTATLSVNHSGVNSPLNISLSGTGTSTTASCGYYAEQNGLLVVEIESAPASQGWTPETYYPNYTGTEYYTWNGPRYLHEKGNGMLTYQFKITDPGKYRFKMRTRNGGPLNTHNNDVWVRFPDHGVTFEKNGAVVQEKSGWWKAWQNNLGAWTYNTWAGESTFWEIYVEFPFAGVYTFEISGRDQLFSMDRWVLYKPDMIGDWSATAANPPASPWENCPSTPLVWYRDKDLDYYGNPLDSVISVSKPGVGWSLNNSDCDDSRKSVYPGAPEILDGRDNDCDGVKDEGAYLSTLNINCGGSVYYSIAGDTFDSDRLFTPLSSGSKFYSGIGDVMNTDDDVLYKTERSVGTQNNYLSYNFQCTSPGAYSVTLYFAETGTIVSPGQRVFDVYIEDSLYLNDLDILAAAGYMTALTYTFKLPVYDGQLNIKFQDVVGKGKINAIQVAKLPNTPPTFTISGSSTYNEDFVGVNTITVIPNPVPSYEASWQTTTYSITPASVSFANVSINPNTGLISITSIPDMVGQQQFTITANDGQSANNTATKTFTLKVLAVNDAPVFTLSGDVTVNEDFVGTQVVSVTPATVPADEASQVVTYSLSPSSVSFANVFINSSTGAVSITAVPDVSGTQLFTVTANDGQALNNTYSKTFTLTVISVNDAPAIDAISDMTINEDAGIQTVNLSGINAGPFESQPLTVNAVSDNVLLVPNPLMSYTSANSTGTLSFVPVANKSGVAHITVTVSDGSLSSNRMFTVTVNPVNDAPVFTLNGNISVNEDFATTQYVTMTPGFVPSDEISQVVTYSLSPSSVSFANVSINSSTGEVMVTSVANASGSQLFTVTADDGQSQNNTYSQTFTLTVNSVNDAPAFTLSGNVTVTEDFATAQHVMASATAVPADEISQVVSYSLSPSSVGFASVSINGSTGEVTISSVANANGAQTFTVTANDGQSQNNFYSQTFTLTVNSVNDAPAFTLSGNLILNEDFAGTQMVNATPSLVPADELSQVVTYSLSPVSIGFANVSINSSTGQVSVIAMADKSGTQTLTVTANDGQSQNNTYSQTFTLTVNPVNDAPSFALSGNVTVNEDFIGIPTVSVTPAPVPADETSQTVMYSLSPASVSFANVSFNAVTGQVTITAIANANGTQIFTVTADDAQAQNNTYSQTFTLTVNPVNDAPAFTLSGDVSVIEGMYTSEVVTASPATVPADELSQVIVYSLSPALVSFANLSINSSTGQVTITPVNGEFGTQQFTVTANDGQSQNNTYSQTFTLTVGEGNTPPSFTISGDVSVNEDFSTAQYVTVTPDSVRSIEAGQVVTYSLSPASVSFANISFDINSGEVTITSIANANGLQQFTITADDHQNRNNLYSKTFTLTVNAVNDTPVFTLSGNISVNEDFASTEHIMVTPGFIPADEMIQVVTYSLSPASVSFANVSVNSTTGEVSITSIANGNGSQIFTITANDGQLQNNTYNGTFSLTVIAENDAPVFTLSGNSTFNEDFVGTQAVDVIPAMVPADEMSQVVTYSLSPSSVSFANVSINGVTGKVSITSFSNESGSQTFTVTANDGQLQNNIYSKTFVLTVNAVNDAPVFTLSGNITANEDFAGTQTVNVTAGAIPADEISQVVTYSLSPSSVSFANVSINSTTGEVSITSLANGNGSQIFTVIANDGQSQNNIYSQTFTLTVNAINDTPVFTLSGNITMSEDFAGTQTVSATPAPVFADEMSQIVTYSLSPSSVTFANVSINSVTGQVSITSIANASGSQLFTVTANDGQSQNNTYSQTFTLTVNAINDTPVFTLGGNITVNEDFAGTRTVNATPAPVPADEMSQTVVYSLSPASVGLANVSINSVTGQVSITSIANANGSQVFTVTANDGQSQNNTYSQIFTLTVNAVNDAPVFTLSGNITVNEDFAGIQTVSTTPAPVPADEMSQTVVYSLSPAAVGFANVSINSTTGQVSITSIANASGSQLFTVTANDGQSQNNTYSQTFTLTVNAVNDAPVFTLSGNITVNEDFAGTQTVSATPAPVPADEMSQTVVYSLSPASVGFANVSINSVTGQVSITSVANANGLQLFTVTANDGQSQNNTYSQTFTLTVNLVNDAPAFTLSGNITVNEDFAGTQAVSVTPVPVPADEMSQNVVYSLTPASVSFANISINSATGQVTITSVTDSFGLQMFTITANDGQSANNLYSQTFTLTVNSVNDAPVFTVNPSVVSVVKNFVSTVTVSVSAAPVPADELLQTVVYSLSPSSVSFAAVAFNSTTGNVNFTSISNKTGSQTFTITANDGQSANNLYSAQFVFSVIDTNYQPALNAINDPAAIDEDAGTQIIQLTGISAGLNESQPITVTAISDNPSLILNPIVSYNSPDNIGTISYAPVANQNGIAVITVTVDDGQAQNHFITRTFTVVVNPVNDEPALNTISDYTIMEDAPMQTVAMTGISAGPNEQQTLTITAVSSNPSLISNPAIVYNSPAASGMLTYAPAADQYGSSMITVTVNDGQAINNISSRTFMVTVNPVDDLPVLTDIHKNGQEDKNLGFQATNFTSHMSDIEGDTLIKIKIISLPVNGALLLKGISVNVMTEILKTDIDNLVYDPAGEFAGVDSFLWNGMAGTQYTLNNARVYININQVNDKPSVVTHIQDINVNEDAPALVNYVNLDDIFYDIEDGANLTYVVLNGNPALVNVVINTDHTLDISFVENANGSTMVAIQAMDNAGATVADTFHVVVNSVEDIPSGFNLLSPVNGSMLSGSSLIEFTWETSTDGDGDAVTYSVAIKGHGLDTMITGVSVASILFNAESLFTADSIYSWYVIASDGDDSKMSAIFSFRISMTSVHDQYALVSSVAAYPNPFNTNVAISYTLKTASKVTLKVLNFLGQEIETLINETQSTGIHKAYWNGDESVSGVYFYELTMETKGGMEGTFIGKIIKD